MACRCPLHLLQQDFSSPRSHRHSGVAASDDDGWWYEMEMDQMYPEEDDNDIIMQTTADNTNRLKYFQSPQ
jgi:hypothetical protein